MKKGYIIKNLNSGFDLLVGFNKDKVILGGTKGKELEECTIIITKEATIDKLLSNIHTTISTNSKDFIKLNVNDDDRAPSKSDIVEIRKSYHKQKGLSTIKVNLLMDGFSKGFEWEWDLLDFTFSIDSARCLYKALLEFKRYLKGDKDGDYSN